MKKFKNFEQAIEYLNEHHQDVTTCETLEDFAKRKIELGMYNVASHICDALWQGQSQYYEYDYSLGTLQTPSALETMEDIKHLLADL